MNDLLQEHRISLTNLAKRENVALPTTWRWARKGVKGIKLETVNIGGRRYSSLEAFGRFVDRTTAAADGEQQPAIHSVTNRQLAARANSTDAALKKHGV